MKQIIYATSVVILVGSTVAFAQGQASGTAQPAGSVMGMFGSGPPPTPPAPGAPTPAPRPRTPARGPMIDLAYEAAKAAIASCTGKPIGVAIVDKSGQAKLVYIPDGSVTDNAATAMRKANTALLIGAPSNQLYARATADKTLAGKVLNNPNYIIWGGGLPITVNGEVIGAIGVSGGGPEGIDDGCAKAALDAIQDRLK
jgi:uncharacterized protein GlcG (DUF336 family)